MKPASQSENEAKRLRSLQALNILDTPPEERFDRITRLAKRLFDVPMVAISLIDERRQWFKSQQGIGVPEIPRNITVCNYTMFQNKIVVVLDALLDDRFADNPLVVNEPKIRFYAGSPLTTLDGSPVGTICIIDQKPRQFGEQDLALLKDLAAMVEVELNQAELSHLQVEISTANKALQTEIQQRQRTEKTLRDREAILELRNRAVEASNNGIVIVDATQPDMPLIFANPAFEQMTGYTAKEIIGQNCRFLQGTDRNQPALDELRTALKEKRDCIVVLRNYRKDGTPFWNELRISPIFDANGMLTHFVGVQVDITERIRAEKALQKSEHRFRDIAESMSDLIWETNSRGHYTYCSDNVEAYLGYTPEEIVGKTVFDLLHPDEYEMVGPILIDSAKNSKPLHKVEHWLVGKTGESRYFIGSGVPVFDEAGNYIGHRGVGTDITARKRAEIRLAKINESFLNFGSDQTENINNLTKLCGELLGATVALYNRLDEGLLCSVGQWQTPPDYQPVDKPDGHICYDVIKQGRDEVFVVRNLPETSYAQTDPNVIPYQLKTYVGHPVKRGNVYSGSLCVVFQSDFVPTDEDKRLISILASAIGVEEQRRFAEETRRESEERFRKLMESTFEGIVIAENGQILEVNQGFLDILGYESEEVVGQSVLDFTAPGFEEVTEHHVRTGSENVYESVAIGKDGTLIDVELVGKAFPYEGRVVRITALRDITERKQTERALIAARDQAVEMSQLKSELLARVSHELRTPLGAILGFAEMLEEDFYGAITTDQREAVGYIIESTNYLTLMVNDLLDQAKLDAGKLELSIRAFNPTKIIEEVQAKMRVLAQARALELTTHIAPDLPETLVGDAGRIQQILMNLVGNAIKFTEAGSVNIRLSRSNATEWMISVSDTGPGIPKEAQSRIFEPFGQVDGSITREHKGTGLGLSIVKQLTLLMQGQILLESEVGQGSTFTITLPQQLTQEQLT